MTSPDPLPGPNHVHQAGVENLVASIRDLASSLSRLCSQLELEVARQRSAAADPGHDLVTEHERLQEEVAQLRSALDSRAVIEQAKGMLMARHGTTADRAFEMLLAMSRTEQRKVRDLAADVVRAGAGQASTEGPGTRTATGTRLPLPSRQGRPDRVDLDRAERVDLDRAERAERDVRVGSGRPPVS